MSTEWTSKHYGTVVTRYCGPERQDGMKRTRIAIYSGDSAHSFSFDAAIELVWLLTKALHGYLEEED